MSAVKTCITCIYKSGDYCTKQPIQPQVDPVTGQPRNLGKYFSCSTQRRFTFNSCGAAGVWWKPIKPKQEKPREPNIFQRATRRLLYMLRN